MALKRSKKIIYIFIISTLAIILSGCTIKKNEPSTYKYTDDNRFTIVKTEKIDDGTTNGLTIKIIVDKETKVMYMQTEKYSGAFAVGLEIMLDKEGKPLIYNKDL